MALSPKSEVWSMQGGQEQSLATGPNGLLKRYLRGEGILVEDEGLMRMESWGPLPRDSLTWAVAPYSQAKAGRWESKGRGGPVPDTEPRGRTPSRNVADSDPTLVE